MNPQSMYSGEKGVDELNNFIKKSIASYGHNEILLVRGKNSYYSSGASEKIGEILGKIGCIVHEWTDFSSNPEYNDLCKGLHYMNGIQPSAIIAVGGGSVIDMAKLMRFFHSYEGDFKTNNYTLQRNPIPLAAIPTTAGTGAEATKFAVLYKNKIKYSVEHSCILPELAWIYPPFTYNNDAYLSACTGFDALAQAIEAYWNRNATAESDTYAQKAIKLIWATLPNVVKNLGLEDREKLIQGAYWAGRAINITKTTAPHAFSYPYTSFYQYPHGHAVALNFSKLAALNILSHNIPEKKQKFLQNLLGNTKDQIENTIDSYVSLLGLTFKQKKEDIDVNLIIDNVNLNRLSNNPVEITRKLMLEILS